MRVTIKKIISGMGMCIVTAGCLMVFSSASMQEKQSEAVLPSQVPDESSAVEDAIAKLDALAKNGETLTDAEMNELLNSILKPEEESAQEENASASASRNPTVDDPASSAQLSETSLTASTSSHSADASPEVSGNTSSAIASSQTVRDSCDEQIAKSIAQLYVQQDHYERELLEIIRQAHQEYVAYPEEDRSLVLKVQVVLSKTGDLAKLEKECDAEVEKICSQMETVLKENGRDTAIVKEARKIYNQKKSELKQELIRQTYSGGDGSGSSGHWLYDQLGE